MDLKQHIQFKKRNPWLIVGVAIAAIGCAIWIKQKINHSISKTSYCKLHLVFETESMPDSLFPMVLMANEYLLFSTYKMPVDTTLTIELGPEPLLIKLIDKTRKPQLTDTLIVTNGINENYTLVFKSFK